MDVFIEYVVIDNFIFDYLLLLLTFKTNGRKPSKKRLLISTLFGTVFAVIFPLLNLHELILFVLKISLAFSMVAIVWCFESFNDYIKKTLKFFALTFAFGGVIYGCFSLIGLNYSFLYGTANGIIPLGVLITIGVVIYKVFERLFLSLFAKKFILPFVCECVIVNKGQIIKVNGFFDSGNQLIYNNKESVCIAGQGLVKRLFFRGMLSGNECGQMCVNTVAGKSVIKIYEMDEIKIYFNGKKNIIYKAKLGVSAKSLKLSDDYQLIIGASYLQ